MLRNEPDAEAGPVYGGRAVCVREGGGPKHGAAVAGGPRRAALLLAPGTPRATHSLAVRGLRGWGPVNLTAAAKGTHIGQIAVKII